MRIVRQCDTYHKGSAMLPGLKPWPCPGCGIETCDSCVWMYGHCKSCCVGKTELALALAANCHGFDFELPAPS